ncbi:MAG: oxygen-independent coproporphyrinogen III oxidase [Dysgonamonadaceae bacterium]|jgi:oxygen-independent coproporphyrinogen-3 oxidase|nr:oxygen-independent coproporphyrinogen III oxidase [Dysgonamonadaceae bacterium]
MSKLLAKYNVPVPRYTSYPPANFFSKEFTATDYEIALKKSNKNKPSHLSFYLHIPFCHHLCHYCGCNSFAMGTRNTIERYVAALHKEIDIVIQNLNPERKIAQIHYGGGTPTVLPSSVLKELNAHLLSAFPQIENPEIAIECHAAYLNESDLQVLADTGFNRFSIGIQDFNEKVLKAVNRRPTKLPVKIVFDILRTAGAKINLDLLYGLPLQTVESFSQTVRHAVELQPNRLVTFSYAHVPWVNPRQLILEKIGLPSAYDKNRIYDTAREILLQSGYKAIGLDHFVKPDDELYFALQNRQLHRNFQGYCTRRTTGQVYAFGVTAISQLATVYAQNDKNIEDYISHIDGGLATIKGYTLSEEEQIVREVIETLMCNYCIDWYELSDRLEMTVETIKNSTSFDAARFREFANDGIIKMSDSRIEITTDGRLFVRNIAAAFDKWQQNTDRKFSKPV